MSCIYTFQDGYAVVAADGPGEYPIIAEARSGCDVSNILLKPGSVAYITTGGSKFDLILEFDDFCFQGHKL